MRKYFYSLLASGLAKNQILLLVRKIQRFVWKRRGQEHDRAVEAKAIFETRAAISIWQPEQSGDVLIFRRPSPAQFGDHFSHRIQFTQHKADDTIRICYFGESAAAGYLYAPGLYPAEHLEFALNNASPDQFFEVIDFSRTNETLDSLLNTFTSAMQLEPELCVIFSGNNWSLLETPEASPHFPDINSRQKIGEIFSREGLDGLADQVVKARLTRAGMTLEKIHRLAEQFNTQIVLVIPEVNLADWESRQPVPLLTGSSNQQWYQLYKQARTHLEEKEWESLIDTGFAMWNLDRGSCPTTYRLIGLGHQGSGDLNKARSAFQAEIDSVLLPFTGFLNAPQASRYDQQLLRRAAMQYNFGLVDLPEIFRNHFPDRLPDRELFLDYCHLTIAGIRIAVSAIAEEITRKLDHPCFTGASFDMQPELAAEDQAVAEFGAAVHTAHRLVPVSDRTELLHYWCKKALQTSAGVAEAMLQLVEARLMPVPEVLTDAQQRNLKSRYQMLHAHGWKYDHLDIQIVQAIQEVLAASHPDIKDRVIELLLKFHAVEDHRIDLISAGKYCWNPLEQAYSDLLSDDTGNRNAYFKAIWPQSDFVFVSRADQDLMLSLALRAPGGKNGSGAQVFVNGTRVASLPISDQFNHFQSEISQGNLVNGANKLSISWPDLTGTGQQPADITERLLLGLETSFFPTFGEIYSIIFSKVG